MMKIKKIKKIKNIFLNFQTSSIKITIKKKKMKLNTNKLMKRMKKKDNMITF